MQKITNNDNNAVLNKVLTYCANWSEIYILYIIQPLVSVCVCSAWASKTNWIELRALHRDHMKH